MRPDFNRGVFYKMTEGKRVGAVFFERWKRLFSYYIFK